MGNLKVILEKPQGNLKVSIGQKFEVEIGIVKEKDKAGIAEIIYNKDYILFDINTKTQNISPFSYSKIKWRLTPIKQTPKPIDVQIIVSVGNLVQMCFFSMEII